MREWPEVSTPWLVVGLVAGVLVLALLAGGITSPAGLSPYNQEWDGTADLRETLETEDHSPLVGISTQAYADLETNDSLTIILSPGREFDTDSKETIRTYLQNGGTVLVAGDFQPAVNGLLADLGSDIRLDGTPVRDERHYYQSPKLPRATRVNDSAYTENVSSLTLNRGTVLEAPPSATVPIHTSEFAYLDADGDESLSDEEEMDHYPVMAIEDVGQGELLVISDSSVFINAMLEQDGNRALVTELQSSHAQVLLDYSHTSGIPPVYRVLIFLRGWPLLQAALGIGALGAVLVVGTRFFDSASEQSSPTQDIDRGALMALLQRRYPHWDEDRIRRLLRNLFE